VRKIGDSGSFIDRFDPEVLHLVVELLSVVLVMFAARDGELHGRGGRTIGGGERGKVMGSKVVDITGGCSNFLKLVWQ
jgi:hypothetical protein